MNTKNKIFAALALSIVVLAGGGFILYDLNSSKASPGIQTEFFLFGPAGQTQAVEIEPFAQPAKSYGSGRMAQNSTSFPAAPSETGLLHANPVPATNFKSGGASGGGYNASAKGRDYNMRATNPGGAGLLAFGGASKSGGRLGGESSNGGGMAFSASAVNTPMAVPFSNSGSGWALVDPEPTTLTPENQIIPVGDGIVPLGLLALLYGAFVWVRRKG